MAMAAMHADTVVDGSGAYFDSLPGDCGYDTAFASRAFAQSVSVPGPVAGPAVCRPVSPLHDTGTIALILMVFLLIALNFKKGHKYFIHLGNYLFSMRRRQNTFDDHTVSETNLMLALVANTCAMGGIILYFAVGHLQPSAIGTGKVGGLIWPLACYVFLFYAAQWIFYRVMCYTFLPDKSGARLLVEGFSASQAVLGLLLCPVAFAMLLWPGALVPMLWIAAILYILCRIVFICKGFRIFFNNLASLLYFILYLCSVEIVPVILSFTGAIFLCRVLQS